MLLRFEIKKKKELLLFEVYILKRYFLRPAVNPHSLLLNKNNRY